jgi:hypothetical protein
MSSERYIRSGTFGKVTFGHWFLAGLPLATDMGRAVRVGGPRSGHSSNGKIQHQRISIPEICLGSDSELKSQTANKWQDCGICQETLIQISTVESRQEPIAKRDFAKSTAPNVPLRMYRSEDIPTG